jgi:hypothetical protein
VSVAAGAAGAAYLARLNPLVRRWTARVAVVGGSVGLAAALGFLVVALS